MRRYLLAAAMVSLCSLAGTAGTLDRPLPADATVLRTSEFAVGPTGQVSDLTLPHDGTFTLDYVVAGTKSVRTMVLTDTQFRQASANRKPARPFPMEVVVRGSGSQSVHLSRGTYHLVWLGDANAHVSYRAWWRSE